MSLFNWVQSTLVGGNGNIANVNATNQLEVINTTPNKIQGDTSGNVLEVTAGGAILVDGSAAGGGNVKIEGDVSGNVAEVTSSGELKVVNPPPTPAAGETAIGDTQFSNMSGTQDNFTTIPSGKVVTISRLQAGAEDANGGSKIELYEAPNGNTTGLILIAVLFVNASSAQADLNYITTAGDGTRAVLLRRERFSGGAAEIFSSWSGVYLT
jgi:hypothetical protein